VALGGGSTGRHYQFCDGPASICVSIALEHNKEAILGIVYAPYLGECFYAIKGKGAWLNGRPIRCSEKSELSKAVVATGMPYDRSDNPDNNLQEICKMALCVRGIRRIGSAAIDLCWDISAGQLIATEAGAIIEPIRSDRNHSILASNPHLHTSIRKILLQSQPSNKTGHKYE